ncbi:MAG: hypothetical protein HZC36_04710 [Armatimonadetes bacterium]|nr:hypothetical protein [Armatimonadota bacterium]
MSFSLELLALLGSFIAAAFALVRLALGHQRALTERFVGFLEESLRRQEESTANFEAALETLACNVRESSAVIARMAERFGPSS